MSNFRDTIPKGVKSTDNTTATPLGIGGTFTGTAELNAYTGVLVYIETDQNGCLYFDFSQDGTNWESVEYCYKVGDGDFAHIEQKGEVYYRTRFVNDSGIAQTYLRITTTYGTYGAINESLNTPISDSHDSTIVRPTDYRSEVAMGKRLGRTTWNKFGFNNDVDAGAAEVVASFGGAFNIMTTADTLDVVSTSANDAAAGTGAISILIDGIDENFLRQTEVVALNGVTPVTTINQWLGVNRAVVLSSGSSQYNEGDINIDDTGGTVGTQAQIPAESSTTQQCIFHTQINHNYLADWVKVNVLKLIGGGGSPRVTIKGYSFSRVTLTRYDVLELKIDTAVENTIDFSTTQPFVIGGREVLYFTASTDVNNTEVSMRFSGIEERIS
jgi:hypothetical protein